MIPAILALVGFGFLAAAFLVASQTKKFIRASALITTVISNYNATNCIDNNLLDAQIRAVVELGPEKKKFWVKNLSNFYGRKIGKQIKFYHNPDEDFVLVDTFFGLWGPAITLLIIAALPLACFIITI